MHYQWDVGPRRRRPNNPRVALSNITNAGFCMACLSVFEHAMSKCLVLVQHWASKHIFVHKFAHVSFVSHHSNLFASSGASVRKSSPRKDKWYAYPQSPELPDYGCSRRQPPKYCLLTPQYKTVNIETQHTKSFMLCRTLIRKAVSHYYEADLICTTHLRKTSPALFPVRTWIFEVRVCQWHIQSM